MLEAIDIRPFLKEYHDEIELVSCGSESGEDARVCDFAWIQDTMNQCKEYNVAFHFPRSALFISCPMAFGTSFGNSFRHLESNCFAGLIWPMAIYRIAVFQLFFLHDPFPVETPLTSGEYKISSIGSFSAARRLPSSIACA
ncbi:MAG: phage Gp37/Gp68 family protein [Lachnospiraceae bacterium]|nr:phage Gp37/Gp68 family protein [Lachnospiraceae bacterium]